MKAPLRARNDSDAAQTDTIRTVAQKRVLADNRPEAVAQMKLAEMMNNSPRVLQQRALSDAIHNSPRMVAQRHEMNSLFGGVPKPEEGGAMLAEASPAQREEKTNNTGLPDQLKSGIESLSGMSMDHVKVHYNSDKPAQLQAHAYARGNEIHLGAGQERHLPHEAWHVVQQAQGRVRPTLQMKAGAVNDDPSLESEADRMGEKAAQFKSGHVGRDLVAEKREKAVTVQRVTGCTQMKARTAVNVDVTLDAEAGLMAQPSESNAPAVVQRWIMMASEQDLGENEALSGQIGKTSSLFEPKSKKPIDDKFVLLSKFEEAKQEVENALKFLDLKDKRGDVISISDVEGILRDWMGVVPDYSIDNEFASNKSVLGEMTDEVLGPKNGPNQYDIRAASQMPAEMRYYVTYQELAWALVQASGLQAAPNMFDDVYAEIAVAQSVSISSVIHENLRAALSKIFSKIAKIDVEGMAGNPDYASFHEIENWATFKAEYEKKYMPKSFVGLISFLHDIKSYFAIKKHAILKNKPEEIIVRSVKKKSGMSPGKKGDAPIDFPGEVRINKEDMRYNLGTVDEADPFVLFMRERGRSLWAAPSFTTVSMLEIVKACGGSKNELTSVAYGIFAFWCIHYPQTATPIHTFHEVMSAAQVFGVSYDPDQSVVRNANSEGLLSVRSHP